MGESTHLLSKEEKVRTEIHGQPEAPCEQPRASPNVPQKGAIQPYVPPHQRQASERDTHDTMDESSKKGLHCEVMVSNSKVVFDDANHMSSGNKVDEKTREEETMKVGNTFISFSRDPKFHTSKKEEKLKEQEGKALMYSGATHNCTHEGLMKKIVLENKDGNKSNETLTDESSTPCSKKIQQFPVTLGEHKCVGCSMVACSRRVHTNHMELKFLKDGKGIVLKGLPNNAPKKAFIKRLEGVYNGIQASCHTSEKSEMMVQQSLQ
ncbi:hypothetical protein KI387_002168, partial [Taxus chinensis]